MKNYTPEQKTILITGHYGTGKTNVAVNLARRLALDGKPTALLDFDIVNPYFRAADCVKEAEALGIRCVVPEYANSNVDVPSLPATVNSVFDRGNEEYAVFDVGGDDAGATALAVYAEKIKNRGYEMLYVINMYRPLTATPEEAVALMYEIEARSRLKCTAIVNNSNLGRDTTREIVEASEEYAKKVCELTSLPLLFTSAMEHSAGDGDFVLKQETKSTF